MGVTQQRGLEAETAILNRLVQLGYEVLHPWNRSLGYDLAYLVEKEERHFGFFVFKTIEVVRIQCKLARISRDGTFLLFNTSTAAEWGRKSHHYRGKAEQFGVYSSDTEKVYLVPVDHVGTTKAVLRLTLPKNKNQWGYKIAKDYEL
ncbi:MAG: hypothetical protein J2P36_28080 [Ktedonobacteraceae bacterium]|nr:hypothetical protein [Ktedonobacteraceae bacterium]